MTTASTPDQTARIDTITLPGQPSVLDVTARRPLPCYTILIHGVNDVGEAYPFQEEGICQGLTDRLARNLWSNKVCTDQQDFVPGTYRLPKAEEAVVADPDRVFYRRNPTNDTYSPVIPFYWGFREAEKQIQKAAIHGQWLDRDGNRLDRKGSKEGGPFSNATCSLPAMWAAGWKHLLRWLIDLTQDDYHPMKKAPHRSYMVLAALRLATVVRIIRRRHPGRAVAVNLVAHSQGCLISLLAQAMLAQDGPGPADALILNNPPYSLDEPALEDQGRKGQTTAARVETLARIVRFVHDKRVQSPDLATLQAKGRREGVAGLRWGEKADPGTVNVRSFTERDNRGRTFLYFSPEDSTVALMATQGIGWQGVPDQVEDDGERLPALPSLGPGFLQRVFTGVLRDGKPVPVGQPVGRHVLRKAEDSGGGRWGAVQRTVTLRHTADREENRLINAPPLEPPVLPMFHLGEKSLGKLSVNPIDAAIAITKGSLHRHIGEEVDDPRPPEKRRRLFNDKDTQALKDQVLTQWNQRHTAHLKEEDKRGATCHAVIDVMPLPNGRLHIVREETYDENRLYRQKEEAMDNSYHSSIVSNPMHSRCITAYDLAIGEGIPWDEEQQRFVKYLCEVADWRINVEGQPEPINKYALLDATGFFTCEEAQNKKIINAAIDYYIDGTLWPKTFPMPDPRTYALLKLEAKKDRKHRSTVVTC